MKNIIKKLAVMATALISAVTFSAASINYSNYADESIIASAASLTNSQITAKLTELQSKYPNGSKWLTTNTVKYGGKQCYAFARQLAVDVFGSYPEKNVVNAVDGEKSNGWTAYRIASKVTLEPGDIIRSDYNAHSAMIWKVEGNYVYVGQCFGSQNNKVNWGAFWGNHKRATVSELLGAGFNGVWKHPGYKVVKPTKSKLSANATSISTGGSITFTASSDTATCYTIGIDKSGKRWKTANMPNGKLTVSFNEEGSYTAYVTASNSAGGLDSAKISFAVKKSNTPGLQTGAIYTIHPKGVNLYIASSGTKNLSNVCLSNKVNNSSKWKLMYDNNKQAYYFVNISSNRVLDINGSSVKNGGGQNVQIYDKNSCATEYFDLIKNSDGTYIIRNHTNKNVCIDCKGSISTLKNSSNVWTYSINYDNTQKFVFTKVS